MGDLGHSNGDVVERARAGAVPGGVVAVPAPGKRARTDGIEVTPGAVYEHGTRCDREPDLDGCGDPARRAYLLPSLAAVALTATDNFRDALQDKRLDLMTRTSTHWTGLVDFLFYEATSPLIALGTRAVMRLVGKLAARAAEHGHDRIALRLAHAAVDKGKLHDKVKNTLTNASRGLRKTLMNLATHAGDKGKAIFLQAVRANTKSFVDSLVIDATTQMTDDEIKILIDGLRDEEFHSVQAYADAIEEILRGYEQNGMEQVGVVDPVSMAFAQSSSAGIDPADPYIELGRLAWVTSGGRRYLALLRVQGDVEEFRRFIDPPYVQLALSLYAARRGAEPDEIAIEGDGTVQRCPWGRAAWLDLITGCPAPAPTAEAQP